MDQRISQLTEYALDTRFEDFPQEVVHQCKRRVIDSLACAMGAYREEPCRIARSIASRSIGKPAARVWGTLDATTPELAAFANGTMVRCEDYNDAYFSRSAGHPSDFLGGILAMGEVVNANGKDILTAITLAYESYCNFSDILLREQGWDYPMHTVVATAVAGSKLLRLPKEKFDHAVALAITPNMPLEQARMQDKQLSMWKGAAGANAARNGVFATLLAADGFTGPDEAFTGRWGMMNKTERFEWAPFGGRGGPYRVTQTHIKYYPALIHGQSPITAALQLWKEVALDDIESIVVDTYWVAERYVNRKSPLWHPDSRDTADHSIAYVIAIALLDGDVNKESYSEAKLNDPRLRTILDKMTLQERPEFTKKFPSSWPCRIEIKTKSGVVKSAELEYFLGHVKNPLSDDQVEGKFRSLSAGVFDVKRMDSILDKLWNLEQVSDIGEVISLLQACGNQQ